MITFVYKKKEKKYSLGTFYVESLVTDFDENLMSIKSKYKMFCNSVQISESPQWEDNQNLPL